MWYMIVNIYKGEMLQRCQDNYTWIYQAHKSTEMSTWMWPSLHQGLLPTSFSAIAELTTSLGSPWEGSRCRYVCKQYPSRFLTWWLQNTVCIRMPWWRTNAITGARGFRRFCSSETSWLILGWHVCLMERPCVSVPNRFPIHGDELCLCDGKGSEFNSHMVLSPMHGGVIVIS